MSNIKLVYDKFDNDHGFIGGDWIDSDTDTVISIMEETLSK